MATCGERWSVLMLIHEKILAMAKSFWLALSTRSDVADKIQEIEAGFLQSLLAIQQSAGIEVHVTTHPLECPGIAGYLDERGNWAADNAASTCNEEDNLRTCGD